MRSPRSSPDATPWSISSAARTSRTPTSCSGRTTGRSSPRPRPRARRRCAGSIAVSVPGADPEAAHPFLRAKGLAEEAVAASGLDHAIVRATHVYGLGGLWFTAAVQGALSAPPFVAGPGDQEIAPLFADDLGAVVAAIDDHAGDLGGTWGLEGPDVRSADGFCAELRDDGAAPSHADGQAAAAALTRLLGIGVDAVAASYLAIVEPRRRPRRRRGLRGAADTALGGAATHARRRGHDPRVGSDAWPST